MDGIERRWGQSALICRLYIHRWVTRGPTEKFPPSRKVWLVQFHKWRTWRRRAIDRGSMRELVSLTAPKGGQLTKKAQSAFWSWRQWFEKYILPLKTREAFERVRTLGIRSGLLCIALHILVHQKLSLASPCSAIDYNIESEVPLVRRFANSRPRLARSENGIDSPAFYEGWSTHSHNLAISV